MGVGHEINHAFTIANEANLTPEELQQLEKQEWFIFDRRGAIYFSKEECKIEVREEGKKKVKGN